MPNESNFEDKNQSKGESECIKLSDLDDEDKIWRRQT